jgi:2-amino-4-hydroxy-6-hydroxymethyldihydropteridine diphosphokinase
MRAFIGLGSNLSQPSQQIRRALATLAGLHGCQLLRHSRLYRTPPLGIPGQPAYVNAAALLDTHLAPLALLDQLQAVEQQQARVRTEERWGPRTLDLDLLLYEDYQLSDPRLSLPHPQLQHRAFVLIPLADIAAGDLLIPGVGLLDELLPRCNRMGIEILDDAQHKLD